MSDTLNIAQADARTQPMRMPQERRSGSRPTSQAHSRSGSRITVGIFNGLDRHGHFRADKEGVDADVPVDAKNASTSDFENCRQFSTAPTPNLFFFKEERRTKNEERTTRNSVT